MREEAVVYSIEPQDVFVPLKRIRQSFDENYIAALAESISQTGQIQPGVCTHEDGGGVTLVAGECRLRACKLAQKRFEYTLLEETDPKKIRQIELEENIRRKDITLAEELRAKKELLDNLQEQFGEPKAGGKGDTGFTQRKFSNYLGESIGKTSEDLEIASFMEHIPEVAEAPTRAAAKKIIKRIKEDYQRHIDLEKAKADLAEREEAALPEGKREAVVLTPGAEQPLERVDNAEAELAILVREAMKKVTMGTMETVLQGTAEQTYDIVTFDPPWRVGFDEVRKKGGGTNDYQDGFLPPEEFRKELLGWLSLLYSRMAQNSHLYLFFGIRNESLEEEEESSLGLGLVYGALEEVGFVTNRMPIIWHKQGAHVTRNPEIWPGRSYEPIAYARKGNKPLVKRGAPDVIITPAPTPTMKQNHPSAKHPMIYLELLRRSAAPGNKVLDPMCGSGMLGVAADTLKHTHALDWHMIEKEQTFYNLSIMNVIKGYARVTGGVMDRPMQAPVEIREPNISEYEPGDEEWMRVWTNFPDKRDEMLKDFEERDPGGFEQFRMELEMRGLL